jgi:hypothetical protein
LSVVYNRKRQLQNGAMPVAQLCNWTSSTKWPV